MKPNPRELRQIRTSSALDALAGLWLMLSPVILGYTHASTAALNDALVGLIVAIFALARFFGAFEATWMSWTNAGLGAWVVLSSGVLGYADAGVALWNNLIAGLVIVILGLWGALQSPSDRSIVLGERDRLRI